MPKSRITGCRADLRNAETQKLALFGPLSPLTRVANIQDQIAEASFFENDGDAGLNDQNAAVIQTSECSMARDHMMSRQMPRAHSLHR